MTLPEGYLDLAWLNRRKDQYGPTDKDFVIRQSTDKAMRLCGGRVGLMLDQSAMLPSEAMFFGTAEHFILDDYISWYHGVYEDGMPVLEMDWSNVYENLIVLAADHDNLILPRCFSSESAAKQWVYEVLFAAHAWIEEVWLPWAVDVNWFGREQKLYSPLGRVKGVPVWLRGSPDGWDDTTLTDWKTSGRGWGKNKAYGQSQDDLYSELIFWNTGGDVDIRNAQFVVYDRQRRTWTVHPTRITEQSREAARLRAFTNARDLILGTWSYLPTNSFDDRHWPCTPKFCPAWDLCPAKYLGGTTDTLPREEQEVWL